MPIPHSSPGAVKWTPGASVSWQRLGESRGTGQCYCSQQGFSKLLFSKRKQEPSMNGCFPYPEPAAFIELICFKIPPTRTCLYSKPGRLCASDPQAERISFKTQLHTLSLEAVTRHLPPCQMAGQCSTLTASPKTSWWHPVKCGHGGLLGTEPGGMWAALLLVSLKAATHCDAEFRKGWDLRANSLKSETVTFQLQRISRKPITNISKVSFFMKTRDALLYKQVRLS